MSAERPTRRGISTRLLLAAAAIGVAGGVVMIPVVFLQVLVAATIPILYTAFVGTFVLGPVIAQALLRHPGAAIIAGVVAGLATAPFTPRSILAIVPMALLGGLYELAFGVTGYRTWPRWRWFAASGLMSLVNLAGVWIVFDLGSFPLWIGLTAAAIIPVSFLAFTLAGIALASRLRAAGVGRSAPALSATPSRDAR
ncbi:ECF transporter S component [Microbacterium sp.]|uniref:ECF transporter S component n=1 Tax=Microbacterium sp. TaxID=51671 RepID=UPI003C73DECF